MSEPASISSGIAERYAAAVFELAQDDNTLATLEADVDALDTALAESGDLAAMVQSPVYSRDQQQHAIASIASAMGLSPVTGNTLALMASKRRLFVLPQLIEQLRAMIADAKGEVTAEITAATALTDAQRDRLASVISSNVGKNVKVITTVDESLIGGLIVKVGSRMIDTSIKAKLANLQNVMKEVG
ncbi:MAG: F0F1 ATP synthase subunit delta [Pseudomonadota bacterium]